jgi:adenylosuccinate lyase
VREPFRAGQKGSSAMPHKRNPIKSEQLSGLARVLRGNAQAALENVALWHERDISHSSVERVILPDSTILIDHMQQSAARLVQGLVVDESRMRANLELTHGALFSQRVLLALVEGDPERGRAPMSRDDAYRIAQELAQRAWDEGTPLRELLASDERTSGLDLDAIFDYGHYTRHAREIVGRLDAIA